MRQAFYVVNTSGQPASFSISFYDDSGHAVSVPVNGSSTFTTLSDTIVGNGTKYYEADNPQGNLIAGSAVISSDRSITIQALFRHHASDGSYYEAAVPSTSGGNEFEIPFDATTFGANGAQIYTGIAIANLDSVNPANVVCTARDSQGNIIPNRSSCTCSQTVRAVGQLSFPGVNWHTRSAGLHFEYKGRLNWTSSSGTQCDFLLAGDPHSMTPARLLMNAVWKT
jgi:hypothetical protein